MRFVYRLKTPGRAWKGWLQAGTSHAIVVGTPQKGVYKVQVAASGGQGAWRVNSTGLSNLRPKECLDHVFTEFVRDP
jgi:hypothetical protein